jgi:hypothetical protein
MERLNLKNDLQVDTKLEKIWSERYSADDMPLSPFYQEEMVKNKITFLSLNHSLLPKDRPTAKRGYYPTKPYALIDSTLDKAGYQFFQKFYDLGRQLSKNWTALDLLYERESIQQKLQIKYNPKDITASDKNFLQSQIRLTFEILEALNPIVVVVSNAWSDKLIHSNLKELNYKQELPSKENGYVYKINNIPFITNESRFLGSLQHFYRSKKDGRLEKLVNEINRFSSSKVS